MTLELGRMYADDLVTLYRWLRDEGWNPGLHDLEIAWSIQSEAFIALREDGRLVAAGSIYRHRPSYGFMGQLVVDRAQRGRGLGAMLWTHRRDLLLTRLGPGATLGLDAVSGFVPFCARGGFRVAHRSLRMTGEAAGTPDDAVVSLGLPQVMAIERCDRPTFPVPRPEFLRRWIFQPDAVLRGIVEGREVLAYGLARACEVGFRLGPVVAARPPLARRLLGAMLAELEGSQVQIDVPEPNQAGLGLARDLGLVEAGAWTRMYCGPEPVVDLDRLYGLTSVEFG